MRDTLFGERFRIRDRVGFGGMGEVWSALDERLQREVAVKLVGGVSLMNDTETRVRFRREVLLAGQLSHRNVVAVHDLGEELVGGRAMLYLVMELLAGQSLRERLRDSLPPWPVAAGWAAQIAHGLHTAHSAGVVHRDVKPANVFLTPDGTVKILDFGVAKFMGDTVRENDLTATGALLGSPPYMSPEQAYGDREIDHRSDLYSLGCLLYQAVTGNPPFTGTGPMAVLRMHTEKEPVPPRLVAEDLPEELNDLILELLAKRPEDRPSDAATVYESLSELLVGQAVTLPDGQRPDLAQLGFAEGLTARLVDSARRIRLRAEGEAAALIRRAQERAKADEADIDRAQGEVERIVAEARRTAEAIVAEAKEKADGHAAARREEADALFEDTREKAAQAARDFELALAERHEKSTHDLDARQAEAQKRLAEIVHSAEALHQDAVRLRAGAESRARDTLERARREADTLLADAHSGAASARGEVEQDVVALTFQRNVLREELATIRAALAQLTGDGDSLERGLLPPLAPAFAVVRRGYDRQQVDAHLGAMRSGNAPSSPDFALVRKGYQPQQVDAYLDLLTQHLGTRLGEEAS